MGVFSDILASAITIDVTAADGITALDNPIIRELKGLRDRMDPEYPAGYDSQDEVQSIAVYEDTVSGGTFTLTITLKSGESFTTAAIAYNANAATIQGAINTAATNASVASWTNGDITVAGGPLTTDPISLTFDGGSVSGQNHPLASADGASLSGGGSMGEISASTEGQSKRTAWAVLYYSGVILGPPPVQGTSSVVTAQNTRLTYPNMPSQDFIRTLAREAAAADGNANVEAAILAAAGIN